MLIKKTCNKLLIWSKKNMTKFRNYFQHNMVVEYAQETLLFYCQEQFNKKIKRYIHINPNLGERGK